MGLLEQNIQSISGYKIKDSHFKIGSKIHVSHFYYAKRFFQNGFFSSRMAFLLAKEISDVINEDHLRKIKEEGLTILGYEMYSEVLLSILKGMLKKLWNLNEKKLNHNLYEDASELRLIKKAEIHPNVIIVVPIATTFSTAPKIENQLRIEGLNKYNILDPLFNVLYVSNESSEQQSKRLEEKFGWEEKRPEERLIKMKSIYDADGGGRNQRYLLSIPSKWHDIKDCELCYPKDKEELSAEKPLFDTDKTKVTPAVIFGLPKGRKFNADEMARTYKLSEEMIYYGYHKRNHAHFLSSIDSEYFLQANQVKVNEWLGKLRKQLINNKGYKETDKVILISPSHYSNAKFIGMVNEALFNGSGNILHYDSSNEYIQNFDLIYGKEIKEAKWVFFVDDSLKSGSAFYKIFRFIESVVPKGFQKSKTVRAPKELKEHPVNGVIVLLNKSQPHVWNHINNLLPEEPDFSEDPSSKKTIFSGFANLHFYNAIKDYEHPPILLEKDRYRELQKSSSLDVLKIRFAEKVNKIRAVDLSKEDQRRDKKKKKKQRLLVIASHKIVEYFTRLDDPNLKGFYDFMNHLIENQDNQIEDYVIPTKIESIDNDFPKSFLKALTQLPFNQYKPLRDVVFKWILELLEDSMSEITITLKNSVLTYRQFDTLKFLMRRACLLNSNALISSKFLKFVVKLYGPNGIPDLVKKTEDLLQTLNEEERPEKLEEATTLKTFFIYYVLQVKELLHKNEYRSLVLETNLREIMVNDNPFIKQLVRVLKGENVAFMQAYRYLGQLKSWKNAYKEDNYYSNKKIEQILDREIVKNHPRFVALNEYFQTTDQQPIAKNETLKNYLWLESFFEHEHKKTFQLIEKTEYIFSKFFDMFKANKIDKAGAFFLVLDNKNYPSKDIPNGPFVAFNKECEGYKGIDLYNFRAESNAYLTNFLSGNLEEIENGDYRKTITELELDGDGHWIDLYQTAFTKKETITLNEELLPKTDDDKFNRLLLIQISKPDFENTTQLKSQGLLGFYYHHESKNLLNPYLVQYLLLLRNSISKFISRHHENDEFRDWKIASIKQRTSLLTGHGREMLMLIAVNRPQFGRIVETLLLVQRFVIDKKDENKIVGEGKGQVSKIFKQYFGARLKKGNLLDKEYMKELGKMACTVFEMEEIENCEEVNIEMNLEGFSEFKFDREILRMICFELFVNAKKNRWIFLDEEKEQYLRKTYSCNNLWINASSKGRDMWVTISNTGPTYTFDEQNLNKGQIKDDESTSGIELIKALLLEFGLGELSFSQAEKWNEENHFGKISVTLHLKEMEIETS